ncbi:MAG: hypothetical protein AAFY55_18305, partial [Bacteroidota bacterium]
EEAGDIFDPVLAQKLYESVFSAGDKQPAMDAYVGFRGREPNVDALLRNRGFIEADAGDDDGTTL